MGEKVISNKSTYYIIGEEDITYLSRYIRITEDIKQKIEKHAKRYGIRPEIEICAWYQDWEDFCSDWCSKTIGYTKTEARKLLHGGIGEFMFLPNNLGIVRFAL